MIYSIVIKISNHMLNRNIIKKELLEVYQYGLELMISCIITSSSIIITACLLDSFLIGMLYFFISVPLKVTVGGYHASTYSKCFIISNLEYIAVSITAKVLSLLFLPSFIWIILLITSVYYILRNCPVKNSNHPISNNVLKRNQHLSFLLLGADCIAITVLYVLLSQSSFLNFSVLSIASIAVFILPTNRLSES